MRAIVIYAVLRAVLFLAPFAVLMVAGVPWYVSLPVALLFAFAASYVFLRRFRLAALEAMVRRRPAPDEDVEDQVLDESATDEP